MLGSVRWLFARGTKIYGNCTKVLSYSFHLMWPRKRFSLPHHSAPLLSRPGRHRIPKVIWQTNYSDRVTIAVYFNYLCNRWLSPTYAYRFMDTGERAAFIKANFPAEVFESYSKLQIGAAQADLWRVLVLYRLGGVYLDIDAHAAWPLGFAIKPDREELFIEHRDGELSNYFMASVPGNPRLELVIKSMLDNINRAASDNVFELTGPAVLNRALHGLNVATTPYRLTCYQGSFTNEFFQYVDHPQGKWVHAQEKISAVRNGA
ncbi:MAG: mannosyltransferase [Xanthobacteraceae bacterium]|nr:mannosyltransferase [Xanthobacteraceae bacterium]